MEEAFVSAHASSIFRYHLIRDAYCFAAWSDSSFVRYPALVAACSYKAKFWLLSS